MQTRKVLDHKGVWLLNNGQFPFVDPSNGNRFDPQVPTQAQKTEWVTSQPTLIDWKSPEEQDKENEDAVAAAAAVVAAAEKAEKAAALAAEAAAAEAAKKAAAEAAKKPA